MTPFDWTPRTRLVFGDGALSRLGELAAPLGRRALIVTDPGIVAAGHVSRACDALADAGLDCTVFSDVHENPDTDDVDACLAAARAFDIDLFVGLGGGSALDTAKGANLLFTNGGAMRDYWRTHAATRPLLPMVAVPTTAGTGSEVQSHALIADAATHAKMAIGDPKATPAIALLDPELTLTLPRQVTAHTGIDALTHAIEAAVTRTANPLSRMWAESAFRLLLPALPRVLERPDDREARGAMLLGAAQAGLSIELSMLGAAHAAANPLTARFGTVHGQAVGLLLPHVIAFNATDPAIAARYDALLSAPALIAAFDDCLQAAGLARSLEELGITDDAIPALAAHAATQWTAGHNPRPITEADFQTLYRAAL